MFNLTDTIAAICTPPGNGGIAGIRISGSDSQQITSTIFSPHLPTSPPPHLPFNHMHAIHGFIMDGEKIIDEVIVLPYKGPKSYTGEDVIEIFCHGSMQIASMILDLCLKNGARQAKAGEFTFRAFINGKIDLTEAEAINEIIHATSEKTALAVSGNLSGKLKEKISDFRQRLFSLVTAIEGSIEFPMDVQELEKNKIISSLSEISLELQKLIEASKEGLLLREGVKVSIVGAANVGKSSLLNQLLENNRAIVTPKAGTTRDIIEEKIIIDGYPVVLLDTAGIRENKKLDEAEKFGIERSKAALEKSDIALLVFDLTQKKDKDTEQIFGLLNGKPRIIVGNKMDLVERTGENCDISISAKYGTNIDSLKKLITEKIKSLSQSTGDNRRVMFYINQRHKELLLQCLSHINFAIEIAHQSAPEDLIADDLKKAISRLDEVTGRKISDEVIQNIFAMFCIGK